MSETPTSVLKTSGAVLVGTLLLAGCGQVPAGNLSSQPSQPSQPAVSHAAPDSDNVAQADSQEGGDRTLRINLLPAKDATFAAQSVVHRWVGNDVFEYLVTLRTGGADLVTIPVLVKNAQTQAVFSHLKIETTYTVKIVALGNIGGTAPSQIINSQNPATGTVLFTGSNDVENTKTLTVQVTLDSVVFDGSATVSIGQTDGSYLNPASPATGSAS